MQEISYMHLKNSLQVQVMVPFCSAPSPSRGREVRFDTMPDLEVTHWADRKCGRKIKTGFLASLARCPMRLSLYFFSLSFFCFRCLLFPGILSLLPASFANSP